MPVDAKTVRAALRARARADRLRTLADEAEVAARAAEAAAGIDQRALAIARGQTKGRGPDALEAILRRGLTTAAAAALCRTSADSLRKAWARGKQLQPAPPRWRKTLARFGVPLESWPDASQD